jgi:hypothetical protein
MKPMIRCACIFIALAVAYALAPARRSADARSARDLPPEERALQTVLAPFVTWIASAHWIAAGAAMEREDPDAAYEHARQLLRWLPHDDERMADLVRYFGLAAAYPMLQESPPRVELAFTLIHRAVELGESALEAGESPEVLDVLCLILTELEFDYHGTYGLDARWERVRAERAQQTKERLLAGVRTP